QNHTDINHVFEQAPVAICILMGPDFTIALSNGKMLEIWCRRLDEVLGVPLFTAFPEADNQGYKELLTHVYTTGETFSAKEMQLELIRNGIKDTQYGNFTYQPLKDENGMVTGIVCIANDVTESVLTRKKIEDSEQRLQKLLMGLPIAVYTTDLNGNVLSYNDEAVKLWEKAPVGGADIWCGSISATRPDGSKMAVEEYPIVRAIKEQRLIKDEVYLSRPNGDVRHVLVHPQPIFSIAGEIVGAVNALVDISEIKEAEKALKASEMRYRQLVQGLPVALYTTDPKGVIEMYNKAAADLWGREPLDGEKAWEIWTGYDLDGNILKNEDKPTYQLVIQNRLMRGVEFVMERPDGLRSHIMPYPEPVYNETGELVGAINMMVDVTVLKQAEQALRESKERFRIVADTAPVMIWMTDSEGNCSFINYHWTEFSGISIQEGLGDGWLKLMHPDDMQATGQAFDEAFNSRKEYSIEFRMRRKDGEYRWVADHGRPRYGANGDFKGYVGTCVDITDRKAARVELEKQVVQRTRELNHQKDFLQTILDSSVDIIAVFDSEARYVAVNKKCGEIYGKSREEMLGRKMEELFPATKGNEFHQLLFQTFTDKSINTLVHQSSITGRQYETFFVPVFDDDKVTTVMAIAHDQTELVAANAKLKQTNEELLRTNQELEQFAYIASHDLQEPLRKIRIFSELLKENVASTELVGKYVDKIAASAGRMTLLIKDVLDYSRLSKTGENFVETDLNAVFENVKTDFDLLIEQKNARINYNGLPVVRGIPLQLHQLFTNLVSNSLKFSDKPPVIEINYKMVKGKDVNHEALHPEKNYAEILFKDNGIGFDEHYAEQIFVIFHRLNDRGAYSGTGIGLALCKKIVENHNGHITATGKPGEGATFKMYLPVYQPQA
ncbi:MAG TPA: PAS domain S-box protein, partial [Bacteroidia bacterium]|nr:PAS domain S-box protein [Bacteroidia bacterium]